MNTHGVKLNRYKKLPAMLIAGGVLSAALPQYAQAASEMEELKALVQQLRSEVNQLKEQQKVATSQAAPSADNAPPAMVPANAAATVPSITDASKPKNFVAGGATFTVYGNADIYWNMMRSSSGKSLNAWEDGAIQRSRVGLKGERPVADGYAMKFNLEQGFNLLSGAAADTTRLFDRQAWLGVATPVGEFRAGRQNTAVFARGNYIDFGARTIGGVINLFGVPSRYDSDLAYISPRVNGFMFEGHVSLAGTTVDNTTRQKVYQAAVDYNNGPYRVGYAGIVGEPPSGSVVSEKVQYHNLYANYDFGKGKVYLAYVHTNNQTTTGSAPNVLNNGGSILNNVGGQVAGTNAEALNYYNIYQLSADYRVTPKLRVGGLYGTINDTSDANKDAKGWALGAYYDIYTDTVLYAFVDQIKNSANAGFRQAASAGLPTNFTAADDVNGRSIRGFQVGALYKF